MVFPDLVIYLVKGVHVHFFIMLLDVVSLSVILIEFGKKSPELDSIIAIFDIFEKDMFGVLFEDI